MTPDRQIRVLLADDTPEIRMLLKINLEVDGRFVVVGEASEGAEAVKLSEVHQPDAVVLDLAMPVLDGLQAIPMIRELSPSTKIAVLSGFTAARMADKALECGADRYLEKGVAFEQIAGVLTELCGKPNGAPVRERKLLDIHDRPATGSDDEAVELLSYLSHELQTPVAAIEGMASTLARSVRLMSPESVASTAVGIHRTAVQLMSLIQKFSEVRAVESGAVRVVANIDDLGAIVAGVVRDLAWYTDPHLVKVDHEDRLVMAFDPVRIRQIVTNVVINAAKFSPAWEPIDIVVRRSGGYAEVTVTDSGPGIAEGRDEAIFGKFVRNGHQASGMGLGLYISRGLARAHGGDLTMERVEGRGARFVLRLPIA